MNALAATFRETRTASVLLTVLTGAAIAGSLDLAFAFVFYGLHGATPVRILQSIASGLLGMSAFTGGWPAAALGAFCHYFILSVATFLYLVAGRQFRGLLGHAVIWGLLYGVAIYLFMHYVVVPLSAAPTFKTTPGAVYGELASHFLVGLSIALVVRRNSGSVSA
jgi:uncharacterized membrane protein YagU involved in acid resistance